MSTAIIIHQIKNKTGYTLQILTPEEGFINAYIRLSKKQPPQVIQPLNLIEIFWKYDPVKKSSIKTIEDIHLLFSFSPPQMEFFHFYAVQSLLIKMQNISYNSVLEEKEKIFLMVSTFLSYSQSCQTPLESEFYLLSLFMKWSLTLKIHEEILYCTCGKKLTQQYHFIRNLSFHADIPRLLCYECSSAKSTYTLVDNMFLEHLSSIIYKPFEHLKIISIKPHTSLIKFLSQYIQYYFYYPIDDLFSKKSNPFIDS